jgi:hypothetical protein
MESSYPRSYASPYAHFHTGLQPSNALQRLHPGAPDESAALQELKKYLKPEDIRHIEEGDLRKYADAMASVFGKMAFTTALPNIDCKHHGEDADIRKRYLDAVMQTPAQRPGLRRVHRILNLQSLMAAENEREQNGTPRTHKRGLPRVNAVLDLPSLCRQESETGNASLHAGHQHAHATVESQKQGQQQQQEERCGQHDGWQDKARMKRMPARTVLSIIDSSDSSDSESSDEEWLGNGKSRSLLLPENAASPLSVKNLYLTRFYDLLYRETGARMQIDWSDPQTRENLTAVSRLLRHALVHREAMTRQGGVNPGHHLTGSQDLQVVWGAAAKLAERLHIPHDKRPAFFLNFFIEANVCEAMAGELDADLNNPLLVFAFDAESHYAEGMANGWLHGLRLAERLESGTPLQVADIEALHAAATKGVALNSTAGRNDMGGAAVSFAMTAAHGLSRAGLKEWRADCARLNRYGDEVIAELKLPPKSGELLTLSEPARQEEEGAWVRMFRNRIYPPHMEAAQKAVVRGVAEKVLRDYREAIEAANARAGEPGFDLAQAKMLAIAGLNQSMERLHAHSDGNGRIYEFLLPNILLLSEGLDAYAPGRPYKCDAGSRLELLEEMQAGQERVRRMRDAALEKGQASHNALEAGLRKKWHLT